MNENDKRRIENAIWTLLQYEDYVTDIAKKKYIHDWEIDRVFDTLQEMKVEFE